MNQTREQVIKMKLMYPFLNSAYIASRVGRSRERVRQILNEEGLPTKAIPPQLYCIYCDEAIEGRLLHKGRCYFEHHKKLLKCFQCEIEFYRHRAHVEQANRRGYEKIFCSQDCYIESRRRA